MSLYDEAITKLAVSKVALEDVLPPRDLQDTPLRTLTFACAGGAGKLAVASAKVQAAPTADGPWQDLDLGSSGLATLAAGSNCVLRYEHADRWLRVQAQGASNTGQTDLTVYINAYGA